MYVFIFVVLVLLTGKQKKTGFVSLLTGKQKQVRTVCWLLNRCLNMIAKKEKNRVHRFVLIGNSST